jgi:hypothetical protein
MHVTNDNSSSSLFLANPIPQPQLSQTKTPPRPWWCLSSRHHPRQRHIMTAKDESPKRLNTCSLPLAQLVRDID